MFGSRAARPSGSPSAANGCRCSRRRAAAPSAARSTISSEARMADIALKGVSKRFGQTLAIDRLDLTIADGEFVVLLGPTGAGKTTTLRLVAGLERADGGTICIDGRDMTFAEPAARDVTFVFQAYS